ncbi:sensor histidine kinase [Paenibacillus arenosi]|uniref:histidine kinase n=1 Tax=Paenibacillus arenosi TaxID=2774142 RepID=A0ABR9AUP4_9BACL|nr:HAMP domain-containing sensor histidine kinase [Paenibacillus arenosi]MBD8497852.1 HAMP domain-containing histidine kinase [Paenibacillus arenosi]
MKLRNWLMSAFLIVMLLPVIAFGLFAYVTYEHDKSEALEEYVQVTEKMQQYEGQIMNPKWYRVQSSERYKPLELLLDDSIELTLYRSDGYRLFSTNKDDHQQYFLRIPAEELYSKLYQLEKTPRAYKMKQPVFHGDQLIGFYDLRVEREQYVEQVSNTVWQLIAGIILFFVILYVIVWLLVKRKLIQPMRHLMSQMSALANNEPVTEWKQASNDEMGILIRHFGNMREDIETAREEVAREQQDKQFMVASLSHDLKTPLTSIQAYMEALENGSQLTQEEQEDYRAIVKSKAEQMRGMLDDLTLFAALRSSKYPTNLIEVEGEELFDMLFSGYDALCSKQGVELKTSIEVQGTYQMDPKQMMRLTDNLVSNALRHTSAGRCVGMAAVSGNEQVPDWLTPFEQQLNDVRRANSASLIIFNEGAVIPDKVLSGLLEPFVQGEQSRPKSMQGFGLGLSITQEIIRRHCGQLHIWSKAPYGTVVMCQFPIHPNTNVVKEDNDT